MEVESLRCAIVDDHPLICEGLSCILRDWGDWKVEFIASAGAEYIEKAMAMDGVDVALVDMSLPDMSCYDVLAWIREHQPRTKAVVLTFDPSQDDIQRSFQCGARGVLGKGMQIHAIRSALTAIRISGYYLDEPTRQKLLAPAWHTNSDNKRIVENLLRRELAILKHLCDPDAPSYKEIASRMALSLNTIHTHRKRIFKKFGITNKLGLYRLAKDWRLFG